jgi:hypothetical protein
VKTYKDSDFTDLVDEVTDEVVGQVPKSWKGTDLVPPGHKVKGGGRASSPAKTEDKSQRSNESGGNDGAAKVPAESENRDVLEAYAVEHAGISADDAKAFTNKADLRAAIVKAVAAKS